DFTTGLNFSNPPLDTRAITEFQKLVNNIQYQQSNSPWLDHAYYYIGVIYRQNAQAAIINSDKQTAFNLALNNFNSVVTKFTTRSFFDDAATKIAQVYHDTLVGFCTEEINWYSYVQSKALDSILKNNATTHLAELQAIPVLNHDCTALPIMTIDIITAPL
ncbi:MAG: tol-pal system YbgF family protein, partial [Gammaproteobacteria bacterium]